MANFMPACIALQGSVQASMRAVVIMSSSLSARHAVQQASQLDNTTLVDLATRPLVDAQRTGSLLHLPPIAARINCPSFDVDAKSGSLCVTIYHADQLSGKATEKAIISLLESNVRHLYENSHTGWHAREKRKELFDSTARFMVIHNDENQDISAFVNWRFDVEECEADDICKRKDETIIEVLYCYEVQVSAKYRNQALGSLLLSLLENIARGSGMRKVMLTTFKSNEPAMRFYKQARYSVDSISPSQYVYGDDEEVPDYEILSKRVHPAN